MIQTAKLKIFDDKFPGLQGFQMENYGRKNGMSSVLKSF
jgi:hypothetical protein